MSTQDFIEMLIESQNVTQSDYWQWNGSEYVISLGALIEMINKSEGER